MFNLHLLALSTGWAAGNEALYYREYSRFSRSSSYPPDTFEDDNNADAGTGGLTTGGFTDNVGGLALLELAWRLYFQ
ncbi:MAG: hypothetical protein AAFV53_30500 [Myxococcota bacterium]